MAERSGLRPLFCINKNITETEFIVVNKLRGSIRKIELLSHSAQYNNGELKSFALVDGHQSHHICALSQHIGLRRFVRSIFLQLIYISNKMIQTEITCLFVGGCV